MGSTIAYLGDARPSKFGTAGITELTKDLNQVVPQSPTGKVDAIFMIGDMDHDFPNGQSIIKHPMSINTHITM